MIVEKGYKKRMRWVGSHFCCSVAGRRCIGSRFQTLQPGELIMLKIKGVYLYNIYTPSLRSDPNLLGLPKG